MEGWEGIAFIQHQISPHLSATAVLCPAEDAAGQPVRVPRAAGARTADYADVEAHARAVNDRMLGRSGGGRRAPDPAGLQEHGHHGPDAARER